MATQETESMADAGAWPRSVVDAVDQILAEAEQLRDAIDGDLALFPVAAEATRSRNSTRHRRQTEVQFLRRHITELDEELMRLNQRNEEGDVVVVRPKGGVSAWQRLAQRQQIACTRSEKENAALRRQVMQRAQQISSIQKLLSDSRKQNSLGIPRSLLSAGYDDATTFGELKCQAAKAFARTDRVMEKHGIGIDEGDGSRITSEFDAVQCQNIAYLASTFVFPFDVHSTSLALWNALATMYSSHHSPLKDPNDENASCMNHVNQDHAVRIEERSDSVYAVCYVAQLPVGGVPIAVRVRDLVVRYESIDSSNRSVIVWQTTPDPSAVSEVHASPVISSGWLVLQQQPDACRSTILQSVFEFRSPAQDSSPHDKQRNPVMEAFVLLAQACVESIALQVDKNLL